MVKKQTNSLNMEVDNRLVVRSHWDPLWWKSINEVKKKSHLLSSTCG